MRHSTVKSAVVRGAVKCDSSVVVPYEVINVTDKNGKEKEKLLAFTFRLPARCSTVTEAIEALWRLPYVKGNVKSLVLVKLPNLEKMAVHVKVAPRWIPQELAIFVAFVSNYSPPAEATRERVQSVLSGCFKDDSTFMEYINSCFPATDNEDRAELNEAVA